MVVLGFSRFFIVLVVLYATFIFVFLNNFVIVRTLLPQYVKVAHFSVGVSRVIGACLCLGYMATCLYLLFPKMVLIICLSPSYIVISLGA
jgi:hypothetical protein